MTKDDGLLEQGDFDQSSVGYASSELMLLLGKGSGEENFRSSLRLMESQLYLNIYTYINA